MGPLKHTTRKCTSIYSGKGALSVRRRFTNHQRAKAVILACALFLLSLPVLVSTHRRVPLTSTPDLSDTAQCRVFVPATKEIVNDVIAVDDEFYGRIGNRIATYKEVFRQALISGCHVKIRRDLLTGWDSGSSLWRNTLALDYPSGSPQCMRMTHTHKYWYFHRLARLKNATQFSQQTSAGHHIRSCATTYRIHTAIMHSTDAHADCVADNAMVQYFSANFTHVLGRRCPQESYAALHVRGGDTTQGKYMPDGSYRSMTIENNYGPHPTSFYTAAIRMMIERWPKVVAICEDLSNPSCETLQSISSVVPQLQVFVARDIMDDLFTLNCAKEVAIARGSFQHAALLRQHARHVHEFRAQPIDYGRECSSLLPGLTCTFHYINNVDLAGLYCENIQSDIWNNSVLHRHFVDMNYDMHHITCNPYQ